MFTRLPEERLSRDDTAADISEIAWSRAGSSNASLRGQLDIGGDPSQVKRPTLDQPGGFVAALPERFAAFAAARPFMTDEEAALLFHRERSEAMINGFHTSMAKCDAAAAQSRDK
ncbi:hypothetical protein LTS16_022698, partial [Friedmanniomyces endolithicus]